jgi:hypothetical protein
MDEPTLYHGRNVISGAAEIRNYLDRHFPQHHAPRQPPPNMAANAALEHAKSMLGGFRDGGISRGGGSAAAALRARQTGVITRANEDNVDAIYHQTMLQRTNLPDGYY